MNLRITLSVLLLVFLTLVAGAEIPERQTGTLLAATFNIRRLSDRSRNDEELEAICRVLSIFDFIAIQEALETDILDRAVRMLYNRYGMSYAYVASDAVGRGGYYEIYAFLYRSDQVSFEGTSALIPDPLDYFIRQPFYANFLSDNFDFYAISTHVVYGKSRKDRLQEAILLDDVFDYVWELDEENDVLLMGDFNLRPDDEHLRELRGRAGLVYLNEEPTTLGENIYDNIWLNEEFTSELMESGVLLFDEEFFNNDDTAAKNAVSDHRPLWVRFNTAADDD
ncbi:MAG: endonuclease/exonuclease/phosphatase family protein [Spirochaetales bacterium]|jgi:endonuclease/exonuclease/phosphatase family metal-dependent hydrolase|nr:endonuclease/exonuclease/phosphatase family protein [Spirochaetales bacterium]